MNRINHLFATKQKNIVSIYFTAGHPRPNTAKDIILALEKNGIDMIEIGMPFSDPLADGPTIQHSSEQALEEGMTVKKLLSEIKDIRQEVKIPLLLMGYFNTVLKYGVEAFCADVSAIGIDGVILPDLPLEVYEAEYKDIFEKYNIIPVFLITPQTPAERIRQTEKLSKGFIYTVSTAATTGTQVGYAQETMDYFKRIADMKLNVPTVVGFGISNPETLAQASQYSNGGIIGSAFVKAIGQGQDLEKDIADFVKILKN
jgi:tryptophan synthase alpha chain